MELCAITKDNFNEVRTIYSEGIATELATFETQAPEWERWDSSHFPFGRIASINNGYMLGWAALSPVSDRCVYGGVAEVSVYIKAEARGQSIGKYLMSNLIDISEKNDIWTLQSGVFRENKASIELHKKCGFRVIGYREKVGQLNGKWLDNILLERRSKIVGV